MKELQVSSHLKNAHPQLYDKSEDCCGCSACFAICPVRAIIMKPNDEGFLYPEIDFKKCIGCYRCISVCVFKDKKGGE